MFKTPEKYRHSEYSKRLNITEGNNGVFIIPLKFGIKAQVIATDGSGWEHVSVILIGRNHTPNWEQMCVIKGLFWDETDTVIQYHPAKQNYVDNHPYCLHMWRPIGIPIPVPPPELIGYK